MIMSVDRPLDSNLQNSDRDFAGGPNADPTSHLVPVAKQGLDASPDPCPQPSPSPSPSPSPGAGAGWEEGDARETLRRAVSRGAAHLERSLRTRPGLRAAIDAYGEDGMTAMHWAIMRGYACVCVCIHVRSNKRKAGNEVRL